MVDTNATKQHQAAPLRALAQSVLNRRGGGWRGLSPWLQRQITKKAGRPAQLSLTGSRISTLLQRLERHAGRVTVWQPQTSSLSPALVSRFTQNIIRRVTALQPEPKYQTRPSDIWAKPPTELTLAGAAAAEQPVETPAPVAFPFTVDQVRAAMERHNAGLPPITPEKPAAMPPPPPPVQRQPALPFSVAEVRAALEQPQFTRAPEIKQPATPTPPSPAVRPRRWVQEVTETGPNEAPVSTIGTEFTPKKPAIQRQTLPPQPVAPTSTPPSPAGEKTIAEESKWSDLEIPGKSVIQRRPTSTMPLSQPETFPPAKKPAAVEPERSQPIVPHPTPPVVAIQEEAKPTRPAPPVQRQQAPELPLRPPAPRQAEEPASLAPEQVKVALPPVTLSPRPSASPAEATAPARPVTSIEPPVQRQLAADLPLRPPAPCQTEETAPLAPEEIKASPPPVTPSSRPTPPPQEATAPARPVTTIEPPVRRVSEMPLRPPAPRQAGETAPVEVEQVAPTVTPPTPPAPPEQTIAPVQVAPQTPPPLQRQPAPDLPLRPPASRQAEQPAAPLAAPAQIAPPIPPSIQRQPVAEMPLHPPASRQAEEPAPVEVEQAAPPVAPTQEIPPPAFTVEPPLVQRQPTPEMPLRPPVPRPLTEASPVEQAAPPVTPASRSTTPPKKEVTAPPTIQRQPAPEMPLSRPAPRQEPPPAKTVDLGTTLQAKAEKVASLPLISPRPGRPPRSKPVEQMAVLPQAREFRGSTNIQKKASEPPARKAPLPFRPQTSAEQRPALPLAILRLTEPAGAAAEPAPARPITPAPPIIQRFAAAEPTAPVISTAPAAVVQRVETETLVAAASLPGEETPPNLDDLARQVYPLIKRMLAVERERRPFR